MFSTRAPFDPAATQPPTLATVGHGVEIRESQIAGGGSGLFTTRSFDEGEAITAYSGQILSWKQARQVPPHEASHMRSLVPMRWTLDGKRLPDGTSITQPNEQLQGLGGAAFANDAVRTRFQMNADFDFWDSPANRRLLDVGEFGDVRPGERIIVLKALRRIEAGEEVFVSYGQQYWTR